MKLVKLAWILPALLLCPLAASAIDIPDMKPGQWQTTIRHTSDKAGTMTICLDAKTQAESKQTAAAYVKKSCSKNETRRNGDKWVTDMVCRLDATTQMITHSETTFGNGDTTYHTEMTSSYQPAKASLPPATTVIDGKFLGACTGK